MRNRNAINSDIKKEASELRKKNKKNLYTKGGLILGQGERLRTALPLPIRKASWREKVLKIVLILDGRRT
jgi:hypothetical protein